MGGGSEPSVTLIKDLYAPCNTYPIDSMLSLKLAGGTIASLNPWTSLSMGEKMGKLPAESRGFPSSAAPTSAISAASSNAASGDSAKGSRAVAAAQYRDLHKPASRAEMRNVRVSGSSLEINIIRKKRRAKVLCC